MIAIILAYVLGRSSARSEQPPYQLTRKQWRRLHPPDYVYLAWRLTILLGVFLALVLVVASFF